MLAIAEPIIRLDFEGHPILVRIGEDGVIWYAAKPLCTVLGFKKMTAALERYVKEANQQPHGVPTAGGVQQMVLVNEAGMRALVAASVLVRARRFKTWIASGVIHAAARAVEAKQEPLLGDTLQGMTEFKPIEHKSEAQLLTHRVILAPARTGMSQVMHPDSKSNKALNPKAATPQIIVIARYKFEEIPELRKVYQVIESIDGHKWYPARQICEDMGYGSLEEGLSLLSDHQMGCCGGRPGEVNFISASGVWSLLGSRPVRAEQGAASARETQPASAHPQEQAMSTHNSTSSQIIPFAFGGKTIRAVPDESGEPCFVGKDVCDALGYANHNKAMNDHCKGVTKRYPLQTPGGMQELRFISEPDVMRLIVNSKLPAAEAFERLVFEEILPAIRKAGRYSAEKAAPQALGPIEAPGTQERLQGAMDVAKALIGVGEAALGYEGLKTQIPKLSHPEVALGLAGLILKNKRFLLMLDDIEHPVIRPLEQNEMIIQAIGHEWIDTLLDAMNQAQLKAMAKLAIARIV